MKKKWSSFIAILAMVITMVPTTGISVFAASDSTTVDVSDTSPSILPTGVMYDGGTGVFTVGAGADNSSITVTGTTSQNVIVVEDGVHVELILSGASITVPVGSHYSPLDLQGNADVTLTLAGGTTSTMSAINTTTPPDYRAGIHVASKGGAIAALTIMGTGTLNAIGGQYGAGIGGGDFEDGGEITISDGIINAKSYVNGAGIGGGRGAAGGTILIDGNASITSTGGQSGAGIGGGENGAGGNITIGGDATITATGGEYAGTGGTGIGGGEQGDSGTILIEGNALVRATGRGASAGIGCGEIGTCDMITINGGTVTAIGGDGAYGGAGIGGGFYSTSGTINISGGTVNATGGEGGSGIGGGLGTIGGTISISGSADVTSTGGNGAAGIGGGFEADGGMIDIHGSASVNATSNLGDGAGIGGGVGGHGGTISIGGDATVTAACITGNGAGIGGGSQGNGGIITISGTATVSAAGYDGGGGAGIGGGDSGAGGTITISNTANIDATGGLGGAGIGGGHSSSGGAINISPSAVVTAVSYGSPYKPAIDALNGSGNVINAELSNAISDTDVSYLKCNGKVLKLLPGYMSFAFSAATASPITAYGDSSCTTVLNSIVTDPGNEVNIPVSATIDAAPTSVTTATASLLTVDLNGGNGSTASSSYVSGATVSIDAGTKSGYTFNSWTSSNGGTFGNASNASTTFTMPGNATTITANWTQNSTGSSGGGGGGGSSYTPPGTNVIVDHNDYHIGTENKGDTNTTVTVDSNKLEDGISKASEGSGVTIPISKNINITAQLVVKNVEDMAKKDMTLTIQTGNVSYNLATSAVDTSKITAVLGTIDTKDIPFNVKISNSNAVVNGATVVVSPVEFTITATYKGKMVEVDEFYGYVNRTIEITAEQANKITTAVVVEPNGNLRHVPTKVTVIGGKYYAVINSLTNSTYTVIWHPIEFSDVTNHWAKDAINNMGSRMVVSGDGNNIYSPDRDITRAEFAAIVVRALGLGASDDESSFKDVKDSDWYCGYIQTAADYSIITGYDATTFGPKDKITREQAMTMISRAMKITGLKTDLKDSEISALIADYSDETVASDYATTSIATCLKTGVITGRSSDTIAPKDYITRAEVATIVQRLLQKSELI